jgi:hypothetical protein
VAQLFSLGTFGFMDIYAHNFAVSSVWDTLQSRFFGGGSGAKQFGRHSVIAHHQIWSVFARISNSHPVVFFFDHIFISVIESVPNKSPEPTRIIAVSCPQGFQWFHIAGSGWLSFFR